MKKDILVKEWIENRISQADIAKKYNVSLSKVEYWIKKHRLTKKRTKSKFVIDESKLTLQDPIFCYLLGLFCTDGHFDSVNNRICFVMKNKGIDNIFRNLFSYFKYNGSVSESNGIYRANIVSVKLCQIIKGLGIESNKTYSLPAIVINNSDDCLRMFLRGCLDGDGNIHTKKGKKGNVIGGQFRMASASPLFMYKILSYINTILSTSYNMKLQSKKYPLIELRVNDSIRLYEYIYRNFEEFYLYDKYIKYKQLKDKDIVQI